MQKHNWKQTLLSCLIITLGAACFAVGFVWFYQPNGIASGGLTGIAQLIHHIFPFIPVGATVIVLNIPLFILGWNRAAGLWEELQAAPAGTAAAESEAPAGEPSEADGADMAGEPAAAPKEPAETEE